MGRFYLGSTVVLLFGPDVMAWEAELPENTPVILGKKIGPA